MEIISNASDSVLTILKPFSIKGECSRWSQYCVLDHIPDGILVFNLLTRELIFLNKEEYERFSSLEYLKKHFFVVPQDANEKEMADFVKWVLSTRQPKSNEITNYTIFTTTDCNARCFYCFELGCSPISMTCETAEKVVRYVKSNCGGKKVNICWLGGEPLFNADVIDVIVDGLRKEGIAFTSKMITNGYLLDDKLIHQAVENWNLKMVQITLDGTEKVYNKIKAYIYKDCNPFEIVMGNIARVLETDIRVSVRLNIDLYNAEDLLQLAGELAQRFTGKKGLSVYAHHLFKGDTPDVELHSEEEWEKRSIAMNCLNQVLEERNLLSKIGISKKIRLNHCMADSGNAVTILPDGHIGLCDQQAKSEFIGHLDRKDYDDSAVRSWKERMPEIPECSKCFYYVDCIKLKKCATNSICYELSRQDKLIKTKRTMRCEYERWLTKINFDEDVDNAFC